MEKLEWLGYNMVKKIRRYLYSFWRNSRTWETDRQTDGNRIPEIAALCIASHGKNPWHFPDNCQIPWHFQVFQTSGHPGYYNRQTYADEIFDDFRVFTDDGDDDGRRVLEVRVRLFNVRSAVDDRLYITDVVCPTGLTQSWPASRADLLYVSA